MSAERGQELPKGAIAWMAGNSVAANLLMIVLLVGGLILGLRIKQEVFPEFQRGTVDINMSYPGASPEEVERGIILAVEQAVQGLDGVDEIQSTAYEGRARVRIEVLEGADLRELADDIKTELDAITSFPDEAEDLRVVVASRRREVLSYALFGDVPEWVLREKAEELRDILLQDPGITQVALEGVREFEIQIDTPQENLRRYGLTLSDVAARIREASVELPGGSLKTEGGEVLIRMKERRDLAGQYRRIPIITLADGSRVLLEDIAQVREGFADTDRLSTFNGRRAIMVEVYQVGAQKPLEVARAAKAVVEDYEANLPDGIEAALLNDRSEVFQQRAELLLRNGYLGLALVFVLLALFLEIRLAFWVSMGVPISILGSFLLLPLTNFSINMISMFAYIVTLGIVVDDAIVVGENIYAHRQRGTPFLMAACLGAREMAMPVTFSVLTNIVAFMPLYFVPGVMGQIYSVIPLVVVTVFAISLVESLFVLPAHLGHQKKLKGAAGPLGWLYRGQQKFSRWFLGFVAKVYGPFLAIVLRHRYITVSLGAALLIVTAGYVQSGRMGMVLFHLVESDFAFASATLPYGSAASRVAEVQNKLLTAAQKVVDGNGGSKLSKGIFAEIDENEVTVRIFLTAPEIRPVSTTAVAAAWRKEVGELPGLETLNFESDRGGPGAGKNLTVELSHRSVSVLDQAGEALARELSFFPGASDIDDGSARGKRQYDFKMKPEGQHLGLRAQDVARQIRYSFYGVEALRLQRGRNEVTVRVRLPESERVSEHSLDNLILRTPSGGEAMLRDAVFMETGRAYTYISRRDARRTVTVTANVNPRNQVGRVIDVLDSEVMPALKNKYPGLSYDYRGRQADQRESTSSLMEGLLLALLAIYALLAVPFRSFTQPLIIMTCVPFGFVGVVGGHLLMGYSLSVTSLFGLVALSGVVVNDSLIMINFANRRREGGADALSAIHQAGIHRFRPILLTTLTTFGGLAPMIFETSRQARFMIPMAISLGFGILFATLITLVLVPALYMMLEDILGVLKAAVAPAGGPMVTKSGDAGRAAGTGSFE